MFFFGHVFDSQEENPELPEYKVPEHLKKKLSYRSSEIVSESDNFYAC